MKLLVVGGTGMIGGHAALHLAELGHDVSLAARKAPKATTALAELPLLLGDYVTGDFTPARLEGFEAIVFAAGNDIRHAPRGQDFATHCHAANTVAVPRFGEAARAAGVGRIVNVGSFYPHVAPALVATNPYVRSRFDAFEGLRRLSAPGFDVVSVDAPFVVGAVPGLSLPMFETYTRYAQGRLEGMPAFGPAGGTNFISTLSLSEAIAGALARGAPGKAYLVGDENLSFADYFGLFFRAAGNPAPVPSLDQEHPLLPDASLYTGRGTTVAYEPDPADVALLGYRRDDVARAVADVVAQYA